MERNGLRVVRGGAVGTAAEAIGPVPDPVAFQEECLRAFEASQVARGFSELTIGNGAGTLQRFLAACGRPAWEVTREDVDRVVGELAAQGLAASTRRGYVQAFKNFHVFLVARKAATAASSPTRTGLSATAPRWQPGCRWSRRGGRRLSNTPPPATIPAARSRSCGRPVG